MRIREGDEWKTAFRTQYGYFKYQVMLFDLSNSPAIFQEYVNKILDEKIDIFVIVYLDDILIYTEDPGQPHVEAIRLVFDQLRKHFFFANLKEMSVSSRWDSLFGVRSIILKNKHGTRKNRGSERLA